MSGGQVVWIALRTEPALIFACSDPCGSAQGVGHAGCGLLIFPGYPGGWRARGGRDEPGINRPMCRVGSATARRVSFLYGEDLYQRL